MPRSYRAGAPIVADQSIMPSSSTRASSRMNASKAGSPCTTCTTKAATSVTRRASSSARRTASLTSAVIGIRATASSAHGHGQARPWSRHSTAAARQPWACASATPIRRRSATESTSARPPARTPTTPPHRRARRRQRPVGQRDRRSAPEPTLGRTSSHPQARTETGPLLSVGELGYVLPTVDRPHQPHGRVPATLERHHRGVPRSHRARTRSRSGASTTADAARSPTTAKRVCGRTAPPSRPTAIRASSRREPRPRPDPVTTPTIPPHTPDNRPTQGRHGGARSALHGRVAR